MPYNPNAVNCQGVGVWNKEQIKRMFTDRGHQIAHKSWQEFNDFTIAVVEQACDNAKQRGRKTVQPEDFLNMRIVTGKSFLNIMKLLSDVQEEEENA